MRSAVPLEFHCSSFPAFLGRDSWERKSFHFLDELEVHRAAAVTSKSPGDKSGETSTGKGPGSELQIRHTAARVGWGFRLDWSAEHLD